MQKRALGPKETKFDISSLKTQVAVGPGRIAQFSLHILLGAGSILLNKLKRCVKIDKLKAYMIFKWLLCKICLN